MPSQEESRLIRLLDENHKWPCIFTFKFIVPADQGKKLESLMTEAQTTEVRPSKGGRYLAYSFACPMGSAQEVLSVFARVQGIAGLVSL